MPKYDVKLQLEDHEHEIHLEVYQQVICSEEQSDEEVVNRAKQQFRAWAERRGPDWRFVATRLPHALVKESDVQVYT